MEKPASKKAGKIGAGEIASGESSPAPGSGWGGIPFRVK